MTRIEGSEPTADPEVVLLTDGDRAQLLERWEDVQAGFVDDPRDAVADADALVAETIERVRRHLDEGRTTLESRWRAGEEPTTEDLRRVLQRYRLFFAQVLAAGHEPGAGTPPEPAGGRSAPG